MANIQFFINIYPKLTLTMDLIIITLVNIIWVLYSLSEGIKESFFTHFRNCSRKTCNFNFKKIFLTQRIIVIALISIPLLIKVGIYSIPVLLSLIFMFRYFHNISYNITTRKIQNDMRELIHYDIVPFKIITKKERTFMIIAISLQTFICIFCI